MKSSHITLFLTSILLFLLFPCASTFAQTNTQTLSVTPPLFQLTVEPGGVWQSSIKVVNGNNYPLTVYAEVVNFAAKGEAGQGRFIPVNRDDDTKSTLAEWIDMSTGPHVIAPEQTKDIPFFVDIPKDATPGGHFAAVLIGTQPPRDATSPLLVQTSQTVTSLFFVRIEGDIVEKAQIREFRTIEQFVGRPEAEFSLRFENKGNVHLQPRGNIVITNMWGKDRGLIPVNNQTHFGNVLPDSIRDFNFSWKGESSITEVGRYKAIATLGYGENGVKSVSAVTYFWVIPVKATVITLLSLFGFIAFVSWAIRMYVRHMLQLAGVDLSAVQRKGEAPAHRTRADVRLMSYKTVSAPLTHGVLDLRKRLDTVTEFVEFLKTIWSFIIQYKVFFLAVLVLVIGFIGLVFYINDAAETDRDYQVTIDEGDSVRILTDEEVKSNVSP